MLFRIKVNNLVDFLDLCRLKGTKPDGKTSNINDNFAIVAEKEGLRVKKYDSTGSVFINVLMKCKVDVEGEMSVIDVDKFIKFLEQVEGIISVSYDNAQITISDEVKTIRLPVPAEEFDIDPPAPIDKFEGKYMDKDGTELETSFEVSAKYLRGVVKDSDKVGVRQFPVEVDHNVSITVGNPEKGEITTILPVVDKQGPSVRNAFSFGISNVFGNIEGQFRIYLGEDTPMVIESIDKSVVDFFGVIGPIYVEE